MSKEYSLWLFVCALYSLYGRSPAVECCADVATRNEGLWLNLEAAEVRATGPSWALERTAQTSEIKTEVKKGHRKSNLMKEIITLYHRKIITKCITPPLFPPDFHNVMHQNGVGSI